MNALSQKPSIETALKQGWSTLMDNIGVAIANTVLFFVLLPIAAITIIFLPAFLGGYLKVMLDLARGESVSIGGFIAAGFRRFWALLFVYPFKYLGIILGFVLIIPGIYLMVRWSFVELAIVEGDLSIREAFRRSGLIVRNKWWEIFGLVIICSFIASLGIGTFLGALITTPLVSLVYAHYYLLSSPALSVETL